jgi:hypothetical protein
MVEFWLVVAASLQTALTVLIHLKSSGFYKRVVDIERIVVDPKKAGSVEY